MRNILKRNYKFLQLISNLYKMLCKTLSKTDKFPFLSFLKTSTCRIGKVFDALSIRAKGACGFPLAYFTVIKAHKNLCIWLHHVPSKASK